jgi:Rrf2 family protein
MRLSKRSEYGLKAAVRLAVRWGSGYVQSRDIAQSEQLPAKFLESILLSLRSAGMLESKVGAGGGYRLAKAPESITVSELIEALEPAEAVVSSAPLNGTRGGENPLDTTGRHALSLLHERMQGAFTDAIGSVSLAELVHAAEQRSQSDQSMMYYI